MDSGWRLRLRARPGLCSQGCPWIQQSGNVPAPCCSWHRWSCANARDLHISSRHKGTHTAAVFHGGDCSVSMGWGRQGNFQLKIRWIGHSEQLHLKKYLLLQLLLVHFFVVAIESQHFCRYLHSKTSDWICVFKLTRHTCLCCSKNHHLPSPDNLLYFLFWPSDYGRFLVCF